MCGAGAWAGRVCRACAGVVHRSQWQAGGRGRAGGRPWRSGYRVRPKFGVPRSDSSLMLDARSGPPIGASGSPPAHAVLRANGPHPKRGRRNPVSQELVRIIYLQRVLVWLYHSEILLARVMAIVGPGPITLA